MVLCNTRPPGNCDLLGRAAKSAGCMGRALPFPAVAFPVPSV